MKTQVVEVNNLMFRIDYLSQLVDEEVFRHDFETNVIVVRYTPVHLVTDAETLEQVDSCKVQLMENVRAIVNDNSLVFHDFIINFRFNRTTRGCFRHHGNEYLSSLELRLDVRWKGVRHAA